MPPAVEVHSLNHWVTREDLRRWSLSCDGAQARLPLDVLLWHTDYFKLKTIRVQKFQEEPLNHPLTT